MKFDAEYIIGLLDKVKSTSSESLESETIEFKNYSDEKALHNSKDLAEEISAFANTKGGIIIIGIRDTSDVNYGDWQQQMCGFERVDLDVLKERIAGRLKPYIDIEYNYITHDAKHYLCINIQRRNDTIVATASGKICIREGKSSRPASPDEVKDLVKSLQFYDWSTEDVYVEIYEVLDMTAVEDALVDYCQRRNISRGEVSVTSFLESIGATRNGILNKGGLLFLGKPSYILRFLGNFEYRFSWRTNTGELKINDVWSECLWNTINRAKKHFNKCNDKIEITFENVQYEFFHLDEIAFHEAFLNALVHRDYSHSGMVSINFLGNQLRIVSPGTFYGGINSENIAYHEPRHRNKSLAKTLMLFQLVDRAGVGVARMGIRSLMYGRSFPNFLEKEDCIEVIMEVEYFRAGIFVVNKNEPNFGIAELFILNSVYDTGYVAISELENKFKRFTEEPWKAISIAMANESLTKYVQFSGSKKGIFIIVKDVYKDIFMVKRLFKANSTSEKHIGLYKFLKKYGSGSNEEISDLLGHKYASQTSAFLKNTEFVKKGKTVSSKWTLK